MFIQTACRLTSAQVGSSIPGYREEEIIRLGIRQGVCNIEQAIALEKAATRLGDKAVVHVKVETGMGRIGIDPRSAVNFIKQLQKMPHLKVEGLFTHFAIADVKDKSYTEQQFGLFRKLIWDLEAQGIRIPLKHACNSAAILDLPHMHLDLVRTGALMYGIFPSPEVGKAFPLQPALTLKSRIVFLKEAKAETRLSYGLTHTVKKDTIIATLPIGHAKIN
jgi:alanine racemase